MNESRIPGATYRLQFNERFGFEDALRIVEYLDRLGITDIYASPLMRSSRGSAHGYDAVDPTRLDPELGPRASFDDLSSMLSSRGMGLIMDFVPNHMAAISENRWWVDVLRNGIDSSYAPFFDIDWAANNGKLLLPVLGAALADVIRSGEISLEQSQDEVNICYFDNTFPLSAASSSAIDAMAGDLEEKLRLINAGKGEVTMVELLEQQHYELAYWREASPNINYRRFFDINELVGLRVEDPVVFDAMHVITIDLISQRKVTGLRLDHIDGLRDPASYLSRLQAAIAQASDSEDGESPEPGFYVVVEKILSGDEPLPADWPVSGTTGYEYMNAVNGLFIDGEGLRKLREFYGDFTSRAQPFDDLVYEKKRQVMAELFPGELSRLANTLTRLASKDADASRLSLHSLHEALTEVTACMPVYRTYIGGLEPSPSDIEIIDRAFAAASKRNKSLNPEAAAFLRRVLTLRVADSGPDETRNEWLDFVMRWQQITGPVMAKGVEDTAFYNYSCLISMNDVGGEPAHEPTSPRVFHEFNAARREAWPNTLNATSTHDTKRSEDVRARIDVLSEITDEWTENAKSWSAMNADLKTQVNGASVPDPDMELLIYQSMLGAWPLCDSEIDGFQERLKAYVIKAAREAKSATSWTEQNAEVEGALLRFVDGLFAPSQSARFMESFQQLQRTVAFYGAVNSLSQVLLKAASPGVPDFYQGSELWDFSLVDPDNRRPVDFAARSKLLAELQSVATRDENLPSRLMRDWTDGRIKLFLTWKALAARREHPLLFSDGEYIPLEVTGGRSGHAVAFARRTGAAYVVAIAPRLSVALCRPQVFPLGGQVWGDTAVRLPTGAPGTWVNLLTGDVISLSHQTGRLLVGDTLARFPVALLLGTGDDIPKSAGQPYG